MISSLVIESIVMLVFFISGILLFKYVDTEDFNSLAFYYYLYWELLV